MEFVVWLFRIGRLSSDSAMAVLNHQLLHRRPLGRVAVAEGKLTSEQVARILDEQNANRPRIRFGELALRLGLLGVDDLRDLLEAQQRDVPSVGSAIARIGGVPHSEQAALLQRFQREMSA